MFFFRYTSFKNFIQTHYDIFRGINATVGGGVKGVEKVEKIVKTGVSVADVTIGTSHTIEDSSCNDPFCCTLDVVGSISSAVGLVLRNIKSTKHLTLITGSVIVGCRSIRYYCNNNDTF